MKKTLALVLFLCIVLPMGAAVSAQAEVTRWSTDGLYFHAAWSSGDFEDGTFDQVQVDFRQEIDADTLEPYFVVDVGRFYSLGVDEESGGFLWDKTYYGGRIPCSALTVLKRMDTVVRFQAQDVVLTQFVQVEGEWVEIEYVTDIDVEFVGSPSQDTHYISRMRWSDTFLLDRMRSLTLTGACHGSFLWFSFEPEPSDGPAPEGYREAYAIIDKEIVQYVTR